MSDEDLIVLATEIEGHPDNVAAAFYGGATIAWIEEIAGRKIGRAVPLLVDSRIKAIVFIPENHLATSKARKLLPSTISHADAVINSSRTALLVEALTHRPNLLMLATEDHLHQQYRGDAMPKSMAFMNALRTTGVAAMISGAGPAVLVLHTGTELEVADLIKSAPEHFLAQSLEISSTGIQHG